VVYEAFPDRAYTAEGNLVSRRLPGAVIKDPVQVAQRALLMAKEGIVKAVDGTTIPLAVQTLCVHGDTPSAVDLVKKYSPGTGNRGHHAQIHWKGDSSRDRNLEDRSIDISGMKILKQGEACNGKQRVRKGKISNNGRLRPACRIW
jgi:hypothetical protein